MKRLCLGLCLCFLIGCANLSTTQLPSVCDTVTDERSLLCEISNESGLRLETVGSSIILVNFIAIETGLYSNEEALMIVKNLRALLNEPISYVLFKTELYTYVSVYPTLLSLFDVYIDSFISDELILERDKEYLLYWLDQNIDLMVRMEK